MMKVWRCWESVSASSWCILPIASLMTKRHVQVLSWMMGYTLESDDGAMALSSFSLCALQVLSYPEGYTVQFDDTAVLFIH